MRNKYNEPKSGCSMLIGCGSLLIITMIISMIIAMAAVRGYIPEIPAAGFDSQEEYSAFLYNLSEKVLNDVYMIYRNNFNYLMTLIYAAQIVVLFLVFKLIYKRPLSQMGLTARHWAKRLGIGCLIGFAAISLCVLTASLSGAAKFSGWNLPGFLSLDMLISLIYFISLGFYDEILYRGFFMTVLKTTRSKWVIIALPAVVYGFTHYQDANAPLLYTINFMLIGLAYAYMFIKTGSIWMSIGYHIVWDYFQSIIYGIQLSEMGHLPLMKHTVACSGLLTGGPAGVEGGLICTAVILGLTACIHLYRKPEEPPVWTMDSDLPFAASDTPL